jgi:hypothetical protein
MVTIIPQGFPPVNIELHAPVRLELDEEDAAELIDLLIATVLADQFQRSSRIQRLHGILAQLLLVAGDSLWRTKSPGSVTWHGESVVSQIAPVAARIVIPIAELRIPYA